MGGKLLILANNSLGLYRFRADLIRTLGQTYTVYASTPRNDHFDDLASIGCHVIETGIDRRGLNPIRDLRLLSATFTAGMRRGGRVFRMRST